MRGDATHPTARARIRHTCASAWRVGAVPTRTLYVECTRCMYHPNHGAYTRDSKSDPHTITSPQNHRFTSRTRFRLQSDGCLPAPPLSGCDSGTAFGASSGTPFRRATRNHASRQRPSNFNRVATTFLILCGPMPLTHATRRDQNPRSHLMIPERTGLLVSTHSERVRIHHKSHYA